jgi:hypothetical protein
VDEPPQPPPRATTALVVALALAAAGFLWQRANGVDLGDEGFIWYGALATARGEVPLRDFRSYDPGWSYWIRTVFALAGRDGFVAVRLAAAAAQAAAFAAILRALARAGLGPPWWLACGVVWLSWSFDVPAVLNATVGLFVVAAGAALLERPTARRHLLAGACAGLAAFIGRNHGLYAALATLALTVAPWPSAARPPLARRLACLALGVVLGYAPMLAMCAATPGFARAFAESVAMWLRLGHTNLERAVPWPWQASAAADPARAWALGLLFLLVPACVAVFLALVLLRPRLRSPLFVSAAVTSAVYLHYTFSRPDEFHLARGAVPPLVAAAAGLVALGGPRWRRFGATVALGACAVLSAWVLAPRHGAWARLSSPDRYRQVAIAGDRLWTERADVVLLRAARQAAADAPGGIYVASTVPGVYAVLGQKSPVWDTYPLLPAPPSEQQAAVAALAAGGVGRALLCPWEEAPGPAGRGFAGTHPLLWEHLRSAWTVDAEPLPYGCRLLRRRP